MDSFGSSRQSRWRRSGAQAQSVPCRAEAEVRATLASIVAKDCPVDLSDIEHHLSAQQLQHWVEQGYCEIMPSVDPQIHQKVIQDADAAYRAGGVGLGHAYNSSPVGNNIVAEVPVLQEIFECPEVDGALRTLLGNGYLNHPHHRPHQNDPGSNSQTLHRDSMCGFEPHRSHFPWWVMAMYYPQQVDADMGPTSVCPGTQFYGGDGSFDSRHQQRETQGAQLAAWQTHEVALTCQAGTVVLVENNLWHRGTANTSSKRRWMFCNMFVRTISPYSEVGVFLPSYRPLATLSAYVEPRLNIWWSVLAFFAGQVVQSQNIDVRSCAKLLDSSEEQVRIRGAYMLGLAADSINASDLLCEALCGDMDVLTKRAAQFGCAVACRQQLLDCNVRNDGPYIVRRLLSLFASGDDMLSLSCAARALQEHGGWGAAPEALRLDVVTTLAAYAARSAQTLSRKPPRAQEEQGKSPRKPPGSGKVEGIVKTWIGQKGFGFILAANGDELYVNSDAFGGGALRPLEKVWFDIELDPKTKKKRAIRVVGPAIWRGGDRGVGSRNVGAAALEAIAVVPQTALEPAAEFASRTLVTTLNRLGKDANTTLVNNTARQVDGEMLMAASLGAVRLVSKCNISGGDAELSVLSAPWWGEMRFALMEVVRVAGLARHTGSARKAGSGGTPGLDQGLRYTLSFCLEALARSGDAAAFEEALASLPPDARGPTTVKDPVKRLNLRRCHLTTPEHSF